MPKTADPSTFAGISVRGSDLPMALVVVASGGCAGWGKVAAVATSSLNR